MRVTAIAAVAENGIIGTGEEMVWHLPEDFQRFKRVTMGHTMFMGRKTFEQVGKLPGRPVIVITRDQQWSDPEAEVAHSFEEAIALAQSRGVQHAYNAGGSQIYQAGLNWTTDLDITRVHQSPASGVRFPDIDRQAWHELSRVPGEEFDFVRYAPIERIGELRLVPIGANDVATCTQWLAGQELPELMPLEAAVTGWQDDGIAPWSIWVDDKLVGLGGAYRTAEDGWEIVVRMDERATDPAAAAVVRQAARRRLDVVAPGAGVRTG